MITLEYTEFINAPVEKVFAFVSNPLNDTQWMSQLKRVKILSETPFGKGTRYRHIFDALGQRTDIEWEVTEYVPNSRISIRGATEGVAVKGTLEFSADGEGTRLHGKGTGTLSGMAKAMEPFVRQFAKPLLETSFGALKKILEQSA